MKNRKLFRIIQISLWSILCLTWVLTGITLLLRSALIQPIESSSNTILQAINPNYTIGSIVFVIGTYIGLIHSITLPSSSKNDIEKIVLPVVFFCFALLNIPSLVNYFLLNNIHLLPLSIIGKGYIGIAFFSFSLMVLLGIYTLGINTSKMYHHIILVGLLILFIVTLIPMNTSLYPQEYLKWSNPFLFITILALLTALSLFNMWSVYIKESTQHNLLRAVRLTLIQVGALGFIVFPAPYTNYFFVFMYIVGITIGFSRERFSQL